MSEKYSTEELVKSVQYWKTLLIPAKRDAIIARLRAADKLCEEAKFPRVGRYLELQKAIADYEGAK